ncbi:hypothetical protein CBR_g19220 [Chara braunii]|uniref:Uncharacterized protein n=1 Tax=Chara braunii TaxID=69332 RepID=A0A388JTK5_CHABU|nr:hypothetical protein CBR_g19220 [Chara braunii]|eukprot:GBG61144.1 hypothetical protein CBR_g19220 [Chara braunii]
MAVSIARALAPASHLRGAISTPTNPPYAQLSDTCSVSLSGPQLEGCRTNSNGYTVGFRVPKARCRALHVDRDAGGLGLGLGLGMGLGLRLASRSESLSGVSGRRAIMARSGHVSRAKDGALHGCDGLLLFPAASSGCRRRAISGGEGREEEKEGGGRQCSSALAAGCGTAEEEGDADDLAEIAKDARRDQCEDSDSTSTAASTNFFTVGLASMTVLLSQALWSAGPALAAYGRLNLPDEIPEVTAEEWHTIILVYGAFAIFYFVIAPPALLHWIRIRDRNKTLLETFIMYYFVFVNFLGEKDQGYPCSSHDV